MSDKEALDDDNSKNSKSLKKVESISSKQSGNFIKKKPANLLKDNLFILMLLFILLTKLTLLDNKLEPLLSNDKFENNLAKIKSLLRLLMFNKLKFLIILI
jgi:hypothetical protein